MLRVTVAPELTLCLLEADLNAQEALVDQALEADSKTAAQDPYGVVLWPAAQVVASELAALPSLEGRRVVELGAGTGLCSLTAAALGADVLATDYRSEPLQLLRRSAELSGLELERAVEVETALFDILSEEASLPPGDVLVAADLLYLKSTSAALAARCVEAMERGYSEVFIGDCGRPGRADFLDGLRAGGIEAQFEAVDGWGAVSSRHELISSRDSVGSEMTVGLLRLSRS